MYIKKCPYCDSSEVKKNGLRNHVQHYKCKCCKRQFQNSHKISVEDVWHEYLELKQTMSEIAKRHHISVSTVKRILRQEIVTWEQPLLWGYAGYVHMDATYWGHTWGTYYLPLMMRLEKFSIWHLFGMKRQQRINWQ